MTPNVPPIFFDEARDLLEAFQRGLLDRGARDAEAINALFRSAHTLKGAAGLFSLEGVVQFAHAAEAVLEAVRSGTVALDEGTVKALLEAHDELERLIDEVAQGHDGQGDQKLVQLLLARAGGAAVPAAPVVAQVVHLKHRDAIVGEPRARASHHRNAGPEGAERRHVGRGIRQRRRRSQPVPQVHESHARAEFAS